MFHQERDEPSLWLAKWLLMGQGISLLNRIFSEYKKKLYFARVVSEGGAAGHPGVEQCPTWRREGRAMAIGC